MTSRKPPRRSDTTPTSLDPDHPNYDAILLKKARLAAFRERRAANQPQLATRPASPPQKPRGKGKGR